MTPENLARLIRNTPPSDEDFRDQVPAPFCSLCWDWNARTISERRMEAMGWDTVEEDPEGRATYVWDVVNLDPRITPENKICVVPFRSAHHSTFMGVSFGYDVRQTYAPVHLTCFYVEMLNGRRKGGLSERECRHCGRAFYSRESLDWCHTCEKPEEKRTCERCGDDLPTWSDPGDRRARKDVRFCSGRCRVAAHRARSTVVDP